MGLSQLQPISSSPVKALDTCLPLGTAPRFGESHTESRAVGLEQCVQRGASPHVWWVSSMGYVITSQASRHRPFCWSCLLSALGAQRVALASPTSSCCQEGANSPPQSPCSAPAAQEHL